MKRSTTDDERGEIPTCEACGRPAGEGSITERDPEAGLLTFCDVRCREDYFARMDLARDADPEGRDAA